MKPLPFLVAAVLLFLTACGDTAARGMVLLPDGRWVANTASRARDLRQISIADTLAPQVAPHWRALVRIDELPEYSGNEGSGGAPEWIWTKVTVEVQLIGDGQAPAPIDDAAVRAVVAKDMAWRVYPRSKLRTKVDLASDPARFAQLGSSPPAAPAAPPAVGAVGTVAPAPGVPVPTAGSARSYTVQAGDTLADISAAYYGSAQHWRRIVAANPGLDPATLKVGQLLVIPPAP